MVNLKEMNDCAVYRLEAFFSELW